MERFIEIQEKEFNTAYQEILEGKKRSHWIWYIFPQIKGLGYSDMTKYYELQSLDEAILYLKNEKLRNNLIKILKALLVHYRTKNINEIMGSLDSMKLLSSLTLFRKANEKVRINGGYIFSEVINKFYNGREDSITLNILNKTKSNCYNNYHYSKNNYNSFKRSYQNNVPCTIKETRKLKNEQKLDDKQNNFNNDQNNDGFMEYDCYKDYINSNITDENKNIIFDKQKDDHSLDFYNGKIECNPIIPGYNQNRNNIFYNNNDAKNEFSHYKIDKKPININYYIHRDYDIINGSSKNYFNQFDGKNKPNSKSKSQSTITRYKKRINKGSYGFNYQ